MIPELELTSFTSLSKERTDQMCISTEACAVGDFGVDIVA